MSIKIPVSLIDAPQDPLRSEMDQEGLFELGSSIKEQGQLQPIAVIPHGDRYEVSYGHRRLAAARLCGIDFLDAIVLDSADEHSKEKMLHENFQREDLPMPDEAEAVFSLFKKYGDSISACMHVLKKSRTWIEARLDYITLDPVLKGHVQDKLYSLAAARTLMRVDNEQERHRLAGHAAKNGCTVEVARIWVQAYESSKPLDADGLSESYLLPHAGVPGEVWIPCYGCGEKTRIEDIQYVRCCPRCFKILMTGGEVDVAAG